MKTFSTIWVKPAFLFILAAMVFNATFAQNPKKDKAAKKTAELKTIIDAKSYVFKAQYAQPMRGGNRYLTSDYDFNVSKDTLVAYLPYFGRAYVAPINPDDAGMMFTTTHFDYKVVESKDGWDISIQPKNAKDVQKLFLTVTKDGYATLRITCLNRDPISYQGYVEAKKKKA
jgi:hypothetical protein